MVHGLSDVPPQRDPERDSPPASREVLRSLGVDVLVDMIEQSSYGVCITGDDHTWLYVNPAGAELIGKPFEQLYGADYLLSFPPHEREALLALEAEQRDGDRSFYTNTVLREDGTEREMTWSGTAVETPLGEVAPAIFHDTSRIRRVQREASALATAAARLAAGGDTGGVLDALARAAVETTRAVACVLLVDSASLSGNGSSPLRVAGRSGNSTAPGKTLDDALERASLSLARVPGGSLLTGGRPVLLGDHRRRLLADPHAASLVGALTASPWEGSALVPLRTDGRLVGILVALLPPEVTSPSEEETEFWSSLADQAGAALTSDRLRAQAGAAAAASERLRIGRDLHDSVSHELFVLRQRAELIERALDSGNEALLRAAASGLEEVSRQAITDMRSLLAELRPDSAPRRDLASALRELAAQVTAQHALAVQVDVDPAAAQRLQDVDGDSCEHLRRLVGEALHNTVKHAQAGRATVTVTVEDDTLTVSISDDGTGHVTSTSARGHGLTTMRERMSLCGGDLTVRSAPGEGTEVVATLPLRAPRR